MSLVTPWFTCWFMSKQPQWKRSINYLYAAIHCESKWVWVHLQHRHPQKTDVCLYSLARGERSRIVPHVHNWVDMEMETTLFKVTLCEVEKWWKGNSAYASLDVLPYLLLVSELEFQLEWPFGWRISVSEDIFFPSSRYSGLQHRTHFT